ncbi:porin family protein [Flavobacterium agrisoli]|uniref:PorT family protein n=1 Tax=Flavobacterium agrisoli TaxID=2793066 RepID=A0A934PMZ0_9FLAO|nr:porin family protein [Flavobacterium agrisoli]MBK0371187.1 PorT family protein [Flavobacterium agrisoli]
MKKIILGVLLTVASMTQMQAQLLQIGVKGGVNFANLTGSDIQTDGITSFHAGLVSEIKLLENFSVQPELLYSTQGAKLTSDVLNTEFKNELGYISIPVLAKFYVADRLSLEVGPQASFLVSEKNDLDIENSETFDFSLVGGLGYKITDGFFVQARYGLGLTDVAPDADVKNSVFQLSAGFMF